MGNESLKSLGNKRRPLLDTARDFEIHRATQGDLDARLAALSSRELDEVELFLRNGGWNEQLRSATLTVLAARIATRKNVKATLPEGRSAQETAAPDSAANGTRAPETVTAGTDVMAAKVGTQIPTPTERVQTPPIETPISSGRVVDVVGRVRRPPQVPPKVEVQRDASRPAEGRGRRW